MTRGTKDGSRLRLVRHGGGGGKGRRSSRDVQRRAPRRKAGRSLRLVCGRDARHGGRAARAQAQVARLLFAASAFPADSRPGRKPGREVGPTTMLRWVCPSSSVRHMPARSRSCSTGSWTRSTAIPWLIVPNRAEVDRVGARARVSLRRPPRGNRRDVRLAVRGARGRKRRRAEAARRDGAASPAPPGRRATRTRRAVVTPGFADALARTLAEVDGALVEPHDLADRSRGLVRRYRDELERLGAWDRGALRRYAIRRLTGELDAWDGRPVLAHGFEDLTAAEWRLLEALAARSDVHVSLPYEPGRAVYASLARTAGDLAALAGGAVLELPARAAEFLPPSLAHLERELFADDSGEGAPRRLGPLPRGCGHARDARARGRGDPRLRPRGDGPGGDRGRVPVGRVDPRPARDGVRVARGAGRVRGHGPRSAPRRSAIRCSRCFGSRGSPASGRRSTRTCARRTPGCRDVTSTGSRASCGVAGSCGATGPSRSRSSCGAVGAFRPTTSRSPTTPWRSSGRCADQLLRNAHGTLSPPVDSRSLVDLEAHDAVARTLHELEALVAAGCEVGKRDVLAALDRTTVRGAPPGTPGRVAVLDLLRARTRRYDTVFVLGLEQGTAPATNARRAVPRRGRASRTRRATRRAARPSRSGEPRPLPVRDRLHPPKAAPRPRAAGGRRRGDAAGAEPLLGGRPRPVRRGRRQAPHGPAIAVGGDTRDRVGPDRARATARARPNVGRRARRGGGPRTRERLGATAQASNDRVRPTDASDPRACAPARRQSRGILGLGARADGLVLRRVVRRALPPPGDDRQGDRPDDARLDPPRCAAALLPAASERDPGSRPGGRAQRRGGGGADERVRRAGGRDRPAHRRGRPRPARARAGAPA